MTPTYKIQTKLQLDVLRFGVRDGSEGTVIHPRVLEAKWSRNNHLEADELTVSIGWKEGGVDPRLVKNARGSFWMWDASNEEFDEKRHLRFTGMAKKAVRRLSDNGWVVDITFHDYSTMFINNKPLKTSGMPEWSDTLEQVWQRICDNTGWSDPSNGKIVSSVSALRDNLVIEVPEFKNRKIGDFVSDRFLKVSRPQPKARSSSWDVWQWCVGALGLMSYIDGDQCIVTRSTDHYKAEDAAWALYGDNIHSLEESVDTDISSKGILLKSFDPLRGRQLEAFYPPPGDERIKTKRSAVGKKSDAGADVTANEVSGEYEEYFRYDITNQTALERAAQEAYDERSRQEIEGSFRTSEIVFVNKSSGVPYEEVNLLNPFEVASAQLNRVDIERDISLFDLKAGDAIVVELRPGLRDELSGVAARSTWGDGTSEQVKYLVDNLGYDPDVALLIIKNLGSEEVIAPVFHIKSIEIDYGPEKFEAEIRFHNLIKTNT